MPTTNATRWLLPALALGAGALFMPHDARAQAWVPSPGQGSVSLGYQHTKVTEHLFSIPVTRLQLKRVNLGAIFGRVGDLSVDYGVLPGLATTANLTYISSKYEGSRPEATIDDGRYHGSLQDLQIGVRYMSQFAGLAVTPTLTGRIPATNYRTIGHTAIGKDKKEIALGVAVGRSLSPLLPSAYAQLSYVRAVVENHHEHSLDQNRFGAGAGYLFGRSVSVGGFLQYVNTVDGIDWATDIVTEEDFHSHDVAAKEKSLRAGGFMSLSLTRGFGLRVAYVNTVSGENTHAARSFSVSPTWNFATPFHR